MSKPIDIQIIQRARDLISDKRCWFGGDQCHMEQGQKCIVIALDDAAREMGLTGYGGLWDSLLSKRFKMDGIEDIIQFNDSHTHKEVLKFMDAALERSV